MIHQLQTLQYVEEENELVKQQEKTLKSEIALLRSKLANCETELLQCKNKVRLLMDDIEIEQRAITTSKQNLRYVLNVMALFTRLGKESSHNIFW